MHKRGLAVLTAAFVALSGTACGNSTTDAVPVQSVSLIMSMNADTQQQIFTGVVSTGNEQSITKDSDKTVSKVYVKTGDQVKEGDKLFTYDSQQAQNNLDKAKLDLEQLQNELESKKEEKEQLEKDKKKASSSEQLDYTLKIASADTDIRQSEYNIGLKEQEIKRLESSTENLDVTAPFDGTIEYAGTADSASAVSADTGDDDTTVVTDDTSYDDSSNSSDAFIKIIETDNYRVKGTINETNIGSLSEGMEMVIHSRTDATKTWSGTLTEIDTSGTSDASSTDTAVTDDTSGDTSASSSSYSFFVSIDSLDGLMIGQHVYMTEATGSESDDGSINLSSSFINDADSESPWVWAEKDGALEKRSVVLGEYNSENDTYPVLEGLTEDDYIASPTDNLAEGMAVEENDAETFRNYVDSLADTTGGGSTDSGESGDTEDGSDSTDDTGGDGDLGVDIGGTDADAEGIVG